MKLKISVLKVMVLRSVVLLRLLMIVVLISFNSGVELFVIIMGYVIV